MSSEMERRKAQSKSAKQSKGKSGFAQSNFVDCNMGKEEKEHFRSHVPDSDNVSDWLDRLMRDGYKMSMSFSDKNDCYQAFLTCPDGGDKNAGLCLSARAASMVLVLAVLYYKSVVMLDGTWTAEVGREFEQDRLG